MIRYPKFVSPLMMVMAATLVCSSPAHSAVTHYDLQAISTRAALALRNITSGVQGDVVRYTIRNGTCIAVVPKMVTGSIIVGGSYGTGIVSCRTPNGWSAPSFFKIAGASIGLQAGYESVDLIMSFTRQDAIDIFSHGQYNLDLSAGGALGPAGRRGLIGVNMAMRLTWIMSYSSTNGLGLGADLNGFKIWPAREYLDEAYSPQYSIRTLLTKTQAPPPFAESFIGALRWWDARSAPGAIASN